jgi:hypothetical protein
MTSPNNAKVSASIAAARTAAYCEASRHFARSSRIVFLTVLVLSAVSLASTKVDAKNGPGTVPASVLAARAVYIVNETSDAQIQTAVYAELVKWGRFQIADTPQKADLILRISNGNMVRFVSGDAATAPTVETKAAPQVSEEPVPPGFTRLTLVEAKTGNSVWSGQKKTTGSPAGWHLLDSLRDAIDKSRNAK